ncbi:hypothetical protein [Flavobacterium litorale]|uniref:Uncharacterized protein n=1 Tax=Flavobacterium litorale TaxID=2856519 RepID=A0ABX8VE76_9FLAO|nr:hypothetical protein [Flavobacterium litorale]QYJ68936.1 hypothetical protein K1I41_03360 [Flavobacterium litorale]
MDFTTMDIRTVAQGTRGDGVRYLQLFLQQYTALFNEKVNPSCPKCLTQYLAKYKNHFKAMADTSKYRLHAKYENIPLAFGSPILVNNTNITTEYATQLLARPNGKSLFAHIPTQAQLEAAKPKPRKKRAAKQQPLQHTIKKQASLETDDTDTLPNNEAE